MQPSQIQASIVSAWIILPSSGKSFMLLPQKLHLGAGTEKSIIALNWM